MLSLFSKKPVAGQTIEFVIDGMHCTSCSLMIDGELEDTPGVIEATTNYGRATTKVVFDEQKVSKQQLQGVIKKLGYTVHEK